MVTSSAAAYPLNARAGNRSWSAGFVAPGGTCSVQLAHEGGSSCALDAAGAADALGAAAEALVAAAGCFAGGVFFAASASPAETSDATTNAAT
jgi:hypothetical protein